MSASPIIDRGHLPDEQQCPSGWNGPVSDRVDGNPTETDLPAMDGNEHAPESAADNGDYGQRAPCSGFADGSARRELVGGL